MALTFEELESVTNDYFMADDGKAVDIYFNTSFLLNYLLEQQKGIWKRYDGGRLIRIPLEYDGQEAEFYGRGDPVSSDDRESVNAAYFTQKHAYGNATLYRIDELENAGRYAEIELAVQRIAGAQKSLTKLLAGSIYDFPGGDGNRLTGLRACCNESTGVAYGGLAETDVVANDGTMPWEGKMTETVEKISLDVIRDMATAAKLRDGADGKPDLMTMPEALWNVIASILQVQQRFTEGKETAKAGFTGLYFEGKDIFPDDYSPSGNAFSLNSKHLGFAVHQKGYFMRAPWRVIPDSAEDRSMKIYFDGNMVANNRKAHIGHSNLS